VDEKSRNFGQGLFRTFCTPSENGISVKKIQLSLSTLFAKHFIFSAKLSVFYWFFYFALFIESGEREVVSALA